MALEIITMQTTRHFFREYLFLRLKHEREKGTRPVCAKHRLGLPTKYRFATICYVFSWQRHDKKDFIFFNLFFFLEKESTYVSPDLR